MALKYRRSPEAMLLSRTTSAINSKIARRPSAEGYDPAAFACCSADPPKVIWRQRKPPKITAQNPVIRGVQLCCEPDFTRDALQITSTPFHGIVPGVYDTMFEFVK
jgi:hypothetical protein